MYRDGTCALVLLCIGVHMAYLLRVGGDVFEYRPLDFYWPLLAVPVAKSIAHLGSGISNSLRRIQRLSWSLGPWACIVILFAPLLFYTGALQGVLLFKDGTLRLLPGRLQIELDEKNVGWAAHRAGDAGARRHLQRPAQAVCPAVRRITLRAFPTCSSRADIGFTLATMGGPTSVLPISTCGPETAFR